METVPPQASRIVFHGKSPDETSPARRLMTMIVVGVILGGVGWYEVDGTLSFGHIVGWLAGSVAVFAILDWVVTRNPILSIAIDDAALTIVRSNGTLTFAWADIEAARFQDYAIAHTGGQTVMRCLKLRVRVGGRRGESFELMPQFADDATRDAFEETLFHELEWRDIPETSQGLPSFERMLSLGGAWVFITSIVAMLIAHAVGFHTLGTIFGMALLFTGSVVAWMTRGQRRSRLVLAATVVLIVAGSAILWACHVNVREVLQKWEQIEKR